ncbi:response regulator [Spirosoma koreense]
MKPLSLRIVLVDDNEDYRRLLRWSLSRVLERITIEEMTTGEQLLAWLAAYRKRSATEPAHDPCQVTIILLDMHMPGLNGLETLQSLGDMSDLVTMPVLMLTASTDSALKQRAYHQGIHLYIVKPTGPHGFHRIIEAVKLCYRDTLQLREQLTLPRIDINPNLN